MSGSSLTYPELYRYAVEHAPSPFEAAQLFRFVTGKDPRLATGDKPDSAAWQEVEKLRELCRQRGQGIPLQYLLGEWEFYGYPFYVGTGVLIPRPDTETLVEIALELLRHEISSPAPEVVDLCAGSGCIGITIDLEHPDCRITAVEKSQQAFDYLRRNIQRNASGVQAVCADIHRYAHPLPVELLVSNPPYIPRKDLANLQQEVRLEPLSALDGGEDGLDFYRTIVGRYREQIACAGWLCLEIGIEQDQAVCALLERARFCSIRVAKDLNGIPRVVYGQKK